MKSFQGKLNNVGLLRDQLLLVIDEESYPARVYICGQYQTEEAVSIAELNMPALRSKYFSAMRGGSMGGKRKQRFKKGDRFKQRCASSRRGYDQRGRRVDKGI